MRRRRSRRRKESWITNFLFGCIDKEIELRVGPLDEFGDTTSLFKEIEVRVAGGITGELVRAKITRIYEDKISATVTKVLEPSHERIIPPCSYYSSCSGCQWQHIEYQTQLKYKREKVKSALEKYSVLRGTIVQPTLPSPQKYGYRNHARFSLNRSGGIGFINRHTRQFVEVDECLIMSPYINGPLGVMQGKLRGMTQMSVRVGINTGQLLIQPKLPNEEISLDSGGQSYVEKLSGRYFKVAGSSFFQVNTPQTEVLAKILLKQLRLSKTQTIVDAYAGVGVYAVLLAPSAARVIAVEESRSAIIDAMENASGLENVEFIQAKTEDALTQIECPVDAIIVDPPRSGCHPSALDGILSLLPQRVAMVSCDPETMARDLSVLCRSGKFVLEDIQPIDMFPQTHHVESVVTLVKASC